MDTWSIFPNCEGTEGANSMAKWDVNV